MEAETVYLLLQVQLGKGFSSHVPFVDRYLVAWLGQASEHFLVGTELDDGDVLVGVEGFVEENVEVLSNHSHLRGL